MDFSSTAERTAAHHDTHALPPKFVQKEHWKYQDMKRADLENDLSVVDFRSTRGLTEEQKNTWKLGKAIPASRVEEACRAYRVAALGPDYQDRPFKTPFIDAVIYENQEFPGLTVIPGLLPPETQVLFTSQLIHRDLSNPTHKINLQTDYNVPYPPETSSNRSFFTRPRASPEHNLIPKTPKHKPLNNEQFLYSKLRWLTLGEQYDWPTRSYAQHATPFPADLSTLVTGLFPHIRPESGVVLVYSAKDFMPVHRDVSEQCSRALASFSVGCDGIFVVARGEDDGEGDQAPKTVAIRVRSGDCVHLDGEARWAWHAMARTIPGTCPVYLRDWPVGTPGVGEEEERRFRVWKGWMGSKRINVSCRQVWD